MQFTGLTEFLLYGLLFAAILLFNFVIQRLGRQARKRRLEEEALKESTAAASAKRPLDVAWGRAPRTEARPPAAPAVTAAAPPPARTAQAAPRRARYRQLFASRQDIRQAVVGMTVLGPCRALEPYRLDQRTD